MKTRRALGERLGGVVKRPRAYLALALPLAVPIILAAVRSQPDFGAPMILASPLVRYDALARPAQADLPEHSLLLTIEKDDTLDAVLVAGGLSRGDSALLTRELAKSIDVRRLRPGHLLRFHYDNLGSVDAVQMKVIGWGDIGAVRDGAAFDITATPAAQRSVETAISATINSSLYEAMRERGEGPQLVQQLVDVFQWDVDFFELQKGDSFSVVTSKHFSGNDLTGYGPVTAARFTHKGVTYEAFRGQLGYYGRNGAPLRKQFLKAPLKFTRITSGFSQSRFHPVLKYFRPHHGVDYGAPIGTPVMTTADGVVVEARYSAGEGNFIRVRHSSRVETYYLHLSRFAKGIARGAKVKQGDVIGYVGMTGLATGPHLDYRVTEDGNWLNPLKLKSITPDPLRGESLRQFLAEVERHGRQLSIAPNVVASDAIQPRALF
ncbi:MAG: M23 family peptidase [Acidobacteria bacterium]|nr:MAG: M23 family peptidase [Acidobacteriota bacterium]